MSDRTFITLTQDQRDLGFAVACIRRGTAYLDGLVHINGWEPTFAEALACERVGACAELAAQLWLGNVEWDRFGIGKPDLAGFIDVKAVDRATDCLIVQRLAKTSWAYLLVDASEEPKFEIVRWIWGKDAKRNEWWRERKSKTGKDRSAYFIERKHLTPLKSLYEEVQRREQAIRGQAAITG
jgi:hypothetical protein